MLELRNITKIYRTSDLRQTALNKVSINFREHEFVSILGPSGSGKTTLLNIIGGLDDYDSGDLIINETSTKAFKDRDWDTYRNHRVGFVFQNYNLISHQTTLQNVELALTLSGVSKRTHRRKAKQALKKVGLEQHIHKLPSQLSGGQAQRVAIARALVNDPDILLADEPTGALDSTTSEQILKILKEVSRNKLVIMVTHNSDLAKTYSTRIIQIKDGKVTSDSKPYDGKIDTRQSLEIEQKKSKKTSMNLKTALGLSLNNLLTKKGRTILTAFAGSIGIIGIALILSLSSGIQDYIDRTEEQTLSSYPLAIEETSYDISSMLTTFMGSADTETYDDDLIHTTTIMGDLLESVSAKSTNNDLTSFKNYLESDDGAELRGLTSSISYGYDVDLNLYKNSTTEVTRINPTTVLDALGMDMSGYSSAYSSMMSEYDVFMELPSDLTLTKDTYDLVAGDWPTKSNEMVIVLNSNGQISDYTLYSLGLLSQNELREQFAKLVSGEEVSFEEHAYTKEELLDLTFKLVLPSDYYQKVGDTYLDVSNDEEYVQQVINNAPEMKVVGIIQSNDEAVVSTNSWGYVGYLPSLTSYIVENTDYSVPGIEAADLEHPNSISLYPKDFDSKQAIEDLISDYNANKPEAEQITYTDYVGTMISAVSTIVDVISAVLIAFVAVSLVVSSIMIAIITYISVLERTKEIGILRAIGASKRDISRVFNAETLIEGTVAGVLGIGITLLLNIPINLIIEDAVGISELSSLPWLGAIVLILISIFLTVLAGLIPAHLASRKDPVDALRTE